MYTNIMTSQNSLIIAFKIFVSLILGCIGFKGLIIAIASLATGPSFSAFYFHTGILLISVLFTVMAVQHNFRRVTKLLKVTVWVFGVFLLLPYIFSIGPYYPHAITFWLLLGMVFSSIFLIPVGLVFISDRLKPQFGES
jgi:NAD/NADP transhydrogenase beta subunit